MQIARSFCCLNILDEHRGHCLRSTLSFLPAEAGAVLFYASLTFPIQQRRFAFLRRQISFEGFVSIDDLNDFAAAILSPSSNVFLLLFFAGLDFLFCFLGLFHRVHGAFPSGGLRPAAVCYLLTFSTFVAIRQTRGLFLPFLTRRRRTIALPPLMTRRPAMSCPA